MASGTILQSTNNSTMTLRYSGTDGQAKVIEVPSTSGTMATEEKSLITLGTAQATTSGTFKDFTIPSGAKRVTVMFDYVSTNGSSAVIIQLGDSGGIENTGYVANGTGTTGAAVGNVTQTIGLPIHDNTAPTYSLFGKAKIDRLLNNVWSFDALVHRSTAGTGIGCGSKQLSSELTTVRITTVNGTDTFDAGTVNVSWEF